MKEEVYQFIVKKHEEKLTTRDPSYVTFYEINCQLKPVDLNILRELVKEKRISFGRTINDIWFKPLSND